MPGNKPAPTRIFRVQRATARRGLSKQHASVTASSEPLHRPSLPASAGADNLPLTIGVRHVDIDYHHVAMSLGLSTSRTGPVQAVAGNRRTPPGRTPVQGTSVLCVRHRKADRFGGSFKSRCAPKPLFTFRLLRQQSKCFGRR